MFIYLYIYIYIYIGSISSLMLISLNIIDILCLHIFFWIRSNSRITFIISKINQFPLNTIKVIREFEQIQKKICRHKMSIMFNEICIYIYIYISVGDNIYYIKVYGLLYTSIFIFTHVYMHENRKLEILYKYVCINNFSLPNLDVEYW